MRCILLKCWDMIALYRDLWIYPTLFHTLNYKPQSALFIEIIEFTSPADINLEIIGSLNNSAV